MGISDVDSSKYAGILIFDDKLISAFGNLMSIAIPDFVKHIDEGAFSRCTALQTVTIPDSVVSIGRHAFYRCEYLDNLVIPDSVTSISKKAFYKCKRLTTYGKANSSGAFRYLIRCDGDVHIVDYTDKEQTSIHIPDQLDGRRVVSLGDSLFMGFLDLEEITIPNSVKYIGDNFCSMCSSLRKLTIPGSVRDIGSNICHSCHSLEEVVIEYGVKGIGSYAFSECPSLEKVYFPDSVEWIHGSPFYGSPNVTLFLRSSWGSTGMSIHRKYDIPYIIY